MKIFKDKLMEWLESEIYKELTLQLVISRRDVLKEVKFKLEQIIQEELEKMKNDYA